MIHRVWAILTVTLLFSGSAIADNAPSPTPTPAPALPASSPKAATIGGGVINPWRAPYRTTVADPRVHIRLD